MFRSLALVLSSLVIGATLSSVPLAQAQPASPEASPTVETSPSPEAPPDELISVIQQIDIAANQRNLDGVMQFFSPTLVHSDGLNYRRLEDAIQALWERYPQLTYQTEVNTWERDGAALVFETTTTITGTQVVNGRDFSLNSTMRSRQRMEQGQIVRQEILSEQNQLSSGVNPPTVEIQLPEQVVIGRTYNFDAIVQEPLGNRLLLGTAIEEPIDRNGYFSLTPINLELLSAGGLFKVGRAPALPDSRWISAVIIREDGITLETRRVRVVGRE